MKKSYSVVWSILWVLLLCGAPAQAQSLTETVKFLFEPDPVAGAQPRFGTLENLNNNTFSIKMDNSSAPGAYNRTTYQINQCKIKITHRFHSPVIKQDDFFYILDLNRVSEMVFRDVAYNILPNEKIGSVAVFDFIGNGDVVCNDQPKPFCKNRETVSHNFVSNTRLDLTHHVSRVVRAYTHLKANYCKGQAF
jgi:hypothetical protein